MRTKFDPYASLASARARKTEAEAAATPATPDLDLPPYDRPRDAIASAAAVASVADEQRAGSSGDVAPVADVAPAADLAFAEAEERAAILQFDGGFPRAWAEGYAKLSQMPVPADVSEERWQLFIDDCGKFLDKWAGLAAQVGWKPADLFGVCRTGPSKRVDLAGVLWLLQGREIAAIDRHAITIRCPTGSTQMFVASKDVVERIIAWDLRPWRDVAGPCRTWTDGGYELPKAA